jgi:hypothetical protein
MYNIHCRWSKVTHLTAQIKNPIKESSIYWITKTINIWNEKKKIIIVMWKVTIKNININHKIEKYYQLKKITNVLEILGLICLKTKSNKYNKKWENFWIQI